MGTNINLTKGIFRAESGKQYDADGGIDVTEFKEVNLMARLYVVEGTGSLTIMIETSMYNEPTNSNMWKELTTLTALSTINTVTTANVTGLQRYLRWRATGLPSTAAIFEVSGIARPG